MTGRVSAVVLFIAVMFCLFRGDTGLSSGPLILALRLMKMAHVLTSSIFTLRVASSGRKSAYFIISYTSHVRVNYVHLIYRLLM